MRNWTLLIVIILITSCKENNAAYEKQVYDKASAPETSYSISKTDYYKDKIRNEFNTILEANILRNNNDSINAVFEEELPFTIPAHLKFKSLELKLNEKPEINDLDEYEYYYSFTQYYWDIEKNEEVIHTGTIAIEETIETIDNQILNTVKIIW